MNIYEAYGRQAEQLMERTEAFMKTLDVLRMISDGKVLPSDLVVEQTGWHLKEEEGGANGDADRNGNPD